MADQWIRKRLQNSVNGNPRYRVTFNDGTTFSTARDVQAGFTIGNSEYDGDVEILTDARGEITRIRQVPA